MRTAACALLLLVCLYEVSADWCSYTCQKKQRYSVRCGWYGWSRCTRYRSVSGTCTEYCKHGGWTEYKETGTRSLCGATCGTGSQIRTLTRTCTNPSPYKRGNTCDGPSRKTEIVDCNLRPCPINGGWSDYSEWEEYDECSAMCGTGKMNQWRSRTCTSPSPAYGGANCTGAELQNRTIDCNTEACGDRCPPNVVKYFDHPENEKRYYQCDNEVAKRHDCSPTTMWDQEKHTCVHIDESVPAAPEPETEDICNGKVLVADSTDCTKFYMCAFGKRTGNALSCAPGLAFNPKISTCDHAFNVPGC
ncbi:hypothetical protein SNE40_000539 [Patella caerulea]|uniref:Chitin-binding type-2 domain-containing protein n=1 Tax=Patella caerulea TaxID=87958 RepID=A0AAN8KE20_PATCE